MGLTAPGCGYRYVDVTFELLADALRGGAEHHVRILTGLPASATLAYVDTESEYDHTGAVTVDLSNTVRLVFKSDEWPSGSFEELRVEVGRRLACLGIR